MWGEKKVVGELREDLCQLQRRIDQLESQAKIAALEGQEIYDKTMRLMQRMAKRYEVDQKENGPTNLPNSTASHLDGLDPISKSIMLRRARQYGPVEEA